MKKLRFLGVLAVILLAFALALACESPAGSSGDGNGDGNGDGGSQGGGPALTSPNTPSTGGAPAEGGTRVTGISLSFNTLRLGKEGNIKTANIDATITPESAINKTVTWESSDPGKATVTPTGATATIAAVAPGTTTIKATATDGGRSATCVVTVAEDLSITDFMIFKTPDETDYFQDDDCDWLPAGGVLLVAYSDNTTNEVPMAAIHFKDDFATKISTATGAQTTAIGIETNPALSPATKALDITVTEPTITFLVTGSLTNGDSYYEGYNTIPAQPLAVGQGADTVFAGLKFWKKSDNPRKTNTPTEVFLSDVTITNPIGPVAISTTASADSVAFTNAFNTTGGSGTPLGVNEVSVIEFAATDDNTNKSATKILLYRYVLKSITAAKGTATNYSLYGDAPAQALVVAAIEDDAVVTGTYAPFTGSTPITRSPLKPLTGKVSVSPTTAASGATVTVTVEMRTGVSNTFTYTAAAAEALTALELTTPGQTGQLKFYEGIDAAEPNWKGASFTATYNTGRKQVFSADPTTGNLTGVTATFSSTDPVSTEFNAYHATDVETHVYKITVDGDSTPPAERTVVLTLTTYPLLVSKVTIDNELSYPVNKGTAAALAPLLEGKVKATYADNTIKTIEITDSKLSLSSGSGKDPAEVDDQVTVTVTLVSGKTKAFDYRVIANP
jgi:hypothetical protein